MAFRKGNPALADLTDVQVSSLVDSELLTYDTILTKWTNLPAFQSIMLGKASFLYDDLSLSSPPSSTEAGQGWKAAQATGVCAIDPGQPGHTGVLLLPTGASASGRCRLFLGTTGNNGPWIVGGGKLRFGWLVEVTALSTALEEFTLRIGLSDTSNGVDGDPNAILFRYNHGVNGGRWELVCHSATVESVADSGVAVAVAWQFLEAEVNAAGTSVQFYIDGTAVGAPITTNIPATSMTIGAGIAKAVGIGTRTIRADFCYVDKGFSPARG